MCGGETVDAADGRVIFVEPSAVVTTMAEDGARVTGATPWMGTAFRLAD